MRVGLCQIDSRVGDLDGNLARIRGAVAAVAAADFVVLPELCVTGYPPRDLLFDEGFVADALAAVRSLATDLADGPPVVVGAVWRAALRPPGHPGLYDAAIVLDGGRVAAIQPKRLLPGYDVFHEPRWFVPGPASRAVELAGQRVGLLVCEDLWDPGYAVHPATELRRDGARVLLALSASPFRPGVRADRLRHARRPGLPLVYVNRVGADDELIFDGASFAVAADGAVLTALPRHEEAVAIVDMEGGGAPGDPWQGVDPLADLRDALVRGIRDFADKNGIPRVIVGLSGGVDSALVAALAVRALGSERVVAVAIPSRFTDPRSTEAARQQALALGVELLVRELEPLHAAALEALPAEVAAGGTVAENLQARLRMVVLTAVVNARGGMLLNTSNKTELALGYTTAWGDQAGTLAPIGDLAKPTVYALAAREASIPRFVRERAPTAELRPDQVDPFDYDAVAPAVDAHLLRGGSSPHAPAIRRAEAKRWHHGVVLKVSERAFGSGRLMPITRTR